jgi:hypothetical protein
VIFDGLISEFGQQVSEETKPGIQDPLGANGDASRRQGVSFVPDGLARSSFDNLSAISRSTLKKTGLLP